ncbi:Ubiquitin carboxyl-terminal hydrolase isozyme L3 [Coemansia sp. RSA 2049]|nr:Ubiquitin carboxyl-terminal hydrolase isozyme L3 [Coemansia sp. RSA 1939]KAJ2524859.1 Ubiquitin carboxyl-terminal hydrolase isozyme L3 [Coemansia sp. RSA 2049]KAJ2612550.1 Ubiquitin carboxyl-terminal hydrolase isozyme L3 [Coemansia sp. RSA 1804]KAJ2691523.1 Ubiquitin carboxyl-terminal hydrolase isozyme L3 [Coemansia sp. RSA 1285]
MSAAVKKIYWIPLEASPESMNKVIHQMGVDPSVKFNDVYGFDDELLDMVSKPVHALVFLFPITDRLESAKKEEALSSENKVSPNVWFMRQTIGNACGTMAIFHALGNNQKTIPMDGNIAEFFKEVNGLSPEDKAKVLEQSKPMKEAHTSGAIEGPSEVPEAEAEMDLHFVTYSIVDGDLYELDGRMPAPINHGPATDVLRDGVRVIKKRIGQIGDNAREFVVVSLNQDQQ